MEVVKNYCYLGFDNILGEQEIENLFTSPEDSDDSATLDDTKDDVDKEDKSQEETKETQEKNNTAEVVNPEELFDEPEESKPEVVGSEKKDVKDKEDTTTDNDSGTSPNNFYSSIANAMAVDGIFPNLTDETIKKVTDADSFASLIEDEVNARLDEKQQRISKALDSGVEPNDIKMYENTLNYISNITDAQLSEEGEKGEQLRRNIIYQDFINKGEKPERAQKLTERSIDTGNDIEDAKDALQSNREYFSNAYNKLLQEAQEKSDKEKAQRAKAAEKLKNDIMTDKQIMGDIEISNDVRKKALDNITRAVYKDPETGDYLTAIQRYEMEHRGDFLAKVGLIFTMTNGFKDFDSFVKGKVKKEVRKGLRDLEHTLNNTSRSSDGSLRMVTTAKDDPYSYIGKGVKLDL